MADLFRPQLRGCRLDEPHRFAGVWRPRDDGGETAGVLTYDSVDGLALELIDLDQSDEEAWLGPKVKPDIAGKVATSTTPAVAAGCFVKTHGTARTVLHVDRALVGEAAEAVLGGQLVSSVAVQLCNLESWLNWPTSEDPRSKGERSSQPHTMAFAVGGLNLDNYECLSGELGDTDATLRFDGRTSWAIVERGFQIEGRATMHIDFARPQSMEAAIVDAESVAALVEMLVGRASPIDSIKLVANGADAYVLPSSRLGRAKRKPVDAPLVFDTRKRLTIHQGGR